MSGFFISMWFTVPLSFGEGLGVRTNLFFCLETKEPKIQGSNFLGYKFLISAKKI